MYQEFYYLIYGQLFGGGGYSIIDAVQYEIGGVPVALDEYLSCLLALVCTITVYVICCLCVWRVIRLFGRLWSRF